jgi:hypothetical protein
VQQPAKQAIGRELTDRRGGQMEKLKEYLAHPIIQIALAPFVAALFEGVGKLREGAWYTRPIVGIIAIALATLLVIVLNA